jgi:hypothetical protein
MDAASISQVATAAGTLVLALATFSSIRAARESTRLAERAMLAAQRPLLIPSRVDDPAEKARFGDGVVIKVEGHRGTVHVSDDGGVFLGLSLRNGGAGMAVIHSWHVFAEAERRAARPESIDDFRRQQLDIWIPSGETAVWRGAIRDTTDADNVMVRREAAAGQRIFVDLVYGDIEGGQRSIARFALPTDAEDNYGRAEVLRYWALDGSDPRASD